MVLVAIPSKGPRRGCCEEHTHTREVTLATVGIGHFLSVICFVVIMFVFVVFSPLHYYQVNKAVMTPRVYLRTSVELHLRSWGRVYLALMWGDISSSQRVI